MKAYAWTNLAFIDVELSFEGHDYDIQFILDGKLSIYEILCEGEPVENIDLRIELTKLSREYLEMGGRLTKLMDNVYYEG